jgi:hypothetical protein
MRAWDWKRTHLSWPVPAPSFPYSRRRHAAQIVIHECKCEWMQSVNLNRCRTLYGRKLVCMILTKQLAGNCKREVNACAHIRFSIFPSLKLTRGRPLSRKMVAALVSMVTLFVCLVEENFQDKFSCHWCPISLFFVLWITTSSHHAVYTFSIKVAEYTCFFPEDLYKKCIDRKVQHV